MVTLSPIVELKCDYDITELDLPPAYPLSFPKRNPVVLGKDGGWMVMPDSISMGSTYNDDLGDDENY